MSTISGFRGEYRWLSNFVPCLVTIDDIVFQSVEEAYQASKTTNREVKLAFCGVGPKQAKYMGRQAIDMRPDWDEVKVEVMRQCLVQKFAPGSEYAKLLTGTSPAFLVEDNWWGDTFWGVCRGEGQNKLGHLLMGIRHKLIYEQFRRLGAVK